MKPSYRVIRTILLALVLGVALGLLSVTGPRQALAADPASAKADLAPLPLKLPAPTLKGTPADLPSGPNIEPPPEKPRPAFLAPKGVQNVAAGKKVISSVKPFTGDVSMVTDGKKEPDDEQVVEMRRGKQYIQVDFGAEYNLYAIVMWHDHRWLQVFHDVIVQVAEDPDFTKEVRTLFNNDIDNSAGLGLGTHKEYFENQEGKLIDAKGVKARYVRCYTAGSSLSAINCWQELEVYGLPAQ